jgi:GNAT superfamily N-acetyltransferase
MKEKKELVKLSFKKISNTDIKAVVKLLKQPMLKNPEGRYHDDYWLKKLIKSGHAIGGYMNNKLVSCVIGENLIDNGVMLWFCAVDVKLQGVGYGKQTLKYFEEYLKSKGKEWIFLNATYNSVSFYRRNKYKSKVDTKVVEHIKYL